jgi:Co/Zn/Cd efflux system component
MTVLYVTYVAAGGDLIVVVWKTVDLALDAVITWSCWTFFDPIVWLAFAVLHHIRAVILTRHSLKLPACATTSANSAARGNATHVAKPALLI